jgi:hypothetical protein
MAPKFEVVQDDELTDRPAARTAPDEVGTSLLLLGLQTVGKRFVAALADLFCLVTVASAFFLWNAIPSPNVYQIVSLTIYAVFVLAANWIVRKS